MNPVDIVFVHEVVFPLFGFLLGGGAIFGLYRTVNRYLERHQRKAVGMDADTMAQVEQLRARVEALETQDRRLEELEERLDFAERVLARRDASGALPNRS